MTQKVGNGRSKEPIPLPRGRQLVTLEDAGKYITKLPKAEHEAPEMANRDGSADACREAQWPDNDGAHRRHESVEPPRRARVQPRPEGPALGTAEAGAGSMTCGLN
jgi:hypothetical protein